MEIQFIKNKKPNKRRKNKIKRVKKEKHSKTSKRIILFVILSLFTFTGLAMYVQIKSGIELSPTLTTCFYAFCTGELWMLASIKKAKLSNGQKSNQYMDKINGLINNNEVNEEEPDNDEEPKG